MKPIIDPDLRGAGNAFRRLLRTFINHDRRTWSRPRYVPCGIFNSSPVLRSVGDVVADFELRVLPHLNENERQAAQADLMEVKGSLSALETLRLAAQDMQIAAAEERFKPCWHLLIEGEYYFLPATIVSKDYTDTRWLFKVPAKPIVYVPFREGFRDLAFLMENAGHRFAAEQMHNVGIGFVNDDITPRNRAVAAQTLAQHFGVDLSEEHEGADPAERRCPSPGGYQLRDSGDAGIERQRKMIDERLGRALRAIAKSDLQIGGYFAEHVVRGRYFEFKDKSRIWTLRRKFSTGR